MEVGKVLAYVNIAAGSREVPLLFASRALRIYTT